METSCRGSWRDAALVLSKKDPSEFSQSKTVGTVSLSQRRIHDRLGKCFPGQACDALVKGGKGKGQRSALPCGG